MTPSVVSSMAQSASQLSTVKSYSSSTPTQKEESKINSVNIGPGLTKDNRTVTVDTIRLSSQALQPSTDIKKDETKKAEVKKEAAGDISKNVNSEWTTAKVQFVYDHKGDLITKYMDSGGNLIYQVPSKLMLFSKEVDSKFNISVDTKA